MSQPNARFARQHTHTPHETNGPFSIAFCAHTRWMLYISAAMANRCAFHFSPAVERIASPRERQQKCAQIEIIKDTKHMKWKHKGAHTSKHTHGLALDWEQKNWIATYKMSNLCHSSSWRISRNLHYLRNKQTCVLRSNCTLIVELRRAKHKMDGCCRAHFVRTLDFFLRLSPWNECGSDGERARRNVAR